MTTNLQFEQLQAQDSIYALARGGTRCFVARASGLYYSDDNGQRWRPAYDRVDVALADALTTTAVAAQGQQVFAGVKGAVLRSSNGGEDWFAAVLPPPAPLISALALSPDFAEDGVLVAATAEDGVFVSTDRGSHWMPWNFGLLDLNVYTVVFSPQFATDQAIYIGTESGIFRSTNGGRAWRAVPFPMSAAPVLSLSFSPDSARDGRIFAGTESQGVYVSADAGSTWERLSPERLTGAVNAIVVAPNEPPELWLLLEDRLQVSRDNGRTWAARASAFAAGAQATALLPAGGPGQASLVGFADGTLRQIA